LLAFPVFFEARVSAGDAGRRATRWDLQRALRLSVPGIRDLETLSQRALRSLRLNVISIAV